MCFMRKQCFECYDVHEQMAGAVNGISLLSGTSSWDFSTGLYFFPFQPQVYIWVLNDEEDFKRAFDLGATGIMTDYPTKLKEFMEKNNYATTLK